MKTLFPMLLLTAFLCGCPDTRVPKAPPLTPQPKAATNTPPSLVIVAADFRHTLSPAHL
jgi:hypothetical protein